MTVFPNYIFIDDSSIRKVYISNVVRSEMEVGPQKTRPIQSERMFQLAFDVFMCADKESEFNKWFTNDIRSGAFWFFLNDPINGVKRRFRFVETEIAWSKSGLNLLSSSFVLEAYDAV